MEQTKLQKAIRREANIRLARLSFWRFCKLMAPDFYLESRPHLKRICETLQALYEGRIVKRKEEDEWQILPMGEKCPVGWFVCKKFMQNLPPQHGKSRTLILFCEWVFGINYKEKIITGSYNEMTATDFSRYTRDGISARAIIPDEVVYHHIFPNTRIKKDNASYGKWALEGNHFSYMGAGVGGSVTSKGGTILIIDDPVKGAEEALSENAMDKTWLWYTGTFLSRVSASQGEPIEIINMTRWSKSDLCGRILADKKMSREWYVIKMPAYDEEKKEMLCPELLSYKRYLQMERISPSIIFRANYKQEEMEQEGQLFSRDKLKRFSRKDLRDGEEEARVAYIDVADQGDDYLCMVVARVFPKKVFITDIIFTKDGSGITIPRCAALINDEKVEATRVETNNQGATFINQLEELADGEIYPVTNTSNKHTRIIMEEPFINKNFYILCDEEIEEGSDYDKAIDQLCSYMKEKKLNAGKHDDAPDAFSGESRFIKGLLPDLFTNDIRVKERDEEDEDEENEEDD